MMPCVLFKKQKEQVVLERRTNILCFPHTVPIDATIAEKALTGSQFFIVILILPYIGSETRKLLNLFGSLFFVCSVYLCNRVIIGLNEKVYVVNKC